MNYNFNLGPYTSDIAVSCNDHRFSLTLWLPRTKMEGNSNYGDMKRLTISVHTVHTP